MILRKHRDHQKDPSIQLSEIDIGMRQCLQSLWSCQSVREQGTEQARAHWMKVAERAWRNFDEDRQFAEQTAEDTRV